MTFFISEKKKLLPFVSSVKGYIYIYIIVGPKGLKTLAHFISSLRPMPKKKNCPMTNEGNPDYQDTLPRMTLSSADQNRRRGRCHIARGSSLEDPKGDSEPNGSAIGAW